MPLIPILCAIAGVGCALSITSLAAYELGKRVGVEMENMEKKNNTCCSSETENEPQVENKSRSRRQSSTEAPAAA